MTRRSAVTLAAIGLVVAGLAAWRAARPAPTAGPPPSPPGAAAALPTLLDFGRDT